ncbi:Aste57867_5676 [Aphanomyces stellatus]|uniref:Aste57867_5676 protein n=2 Tax=Aphanomyces stellatus TaxID=120398 RepID=A0A485KHG1_9STRA|nr:hypothetical protein As57867_005663 [Aphanomyces stellatus]VFT82716.1 Aste57867_5676 [Aphanomyces stellatus]
MVLSRGDVNLSTDGRFTEGIKAPKVNHYYNLFHPLDPIAYRVEPLLHANTSDLPAVQLVAADTLKTKSFGQIVELYDAVASPTRQDFVLRRQQREGPIELAYAPFSHSSYWTSQDVVLFTLLQVCRPVADTVRMYMNAGKPFPTLLPRRLTLFTPHKMPRLATTADVRDRTTGGWYPQPIFLGRKHHVYYVANAKDIAVQKKWSIPFTAATTVESSESNALEFRLVPEKTNKMYAMLPPNSSVNATQVFKASSPALRDEWVDAVRRVIVTLGDASSTSSSLATDGLVLPSNLTVDYFGAVKTSLLSYVWGSKWFVLTRTGLDCYDSLPAADKWIQFPFKTVFLAPKHGHVRFVDEVGTAMSVKIADRGTFDAWVKAVQATANADIVVDDSFVQ